MIPNNSANSTTTVPTTTRQLVSNSSTVAPNKIQVNTKNNQQATPNVETNLNRTTDNKVSNFTASPSARSQQVTSNHGASQTPTSVGLYGYNWNLPPHQWSLPVEPSTDSLIPNTEQYTLGSIGKYRRARIYWYSRVDNTYVDTTTYNSGKGKHAKDPRYGFQFLWNPTEFTTSVAVNLNITPTFADSFVDVIGAFPSGEYLSVEFIIDRVNDFASIRDIPAGSKVGTDVYKKYADSYAKYYAGNNSFDSFVGATNNIGNKIYDLQRYGTIADLEYLYKAINGPGWKNSATGRDSSDIGFLTPALLRIDIGPLSYIGYVNNIVVNHNYFSKGMVPIRTTVGLQFNLMATAGLSNKK
jgi:hypothetical protein